jgi:segregation and condensation protein A
MSYVTKIEKFEGPLDLLLKLIEKEKMDITDVSLVNITDQFLEHIKKLEIINPENLADFLVIAAQLILIKSKALLPDLEVDEEDEISAEELAARLREYKIFKDQAQVINNLYKDKNFSFEQEMDMEKTTVFYPGKNITLDGLRQAMDSLIVGLNKFKSLAEKTVMQTVSLKEKIAHLQDTITKQAKVKFDDIVKNAKTRLDAVVSFLALLELVKQQSIEVEQDKNFGEITARKKYNNKKNGE